MSSATPFTKPLHGVAIIGMAGRFPGASNVRAFWDNLRNGRESIDFFSDAELAQAGVDGETLRDPNYVKARSTLADVEMFDAGFFGYTPHEAAHMDPQQRVFLETAWEALEDAGCDSARFPGPIGLFAGCYLDTYLLANLCSTREFIEGLLSFKRVGAFQTFLGNDKDYLATRTAYKLGLKGPALTLQTACSTSLVAVCTAYQSLMTCQTDVALAGGVTITFPQKKGYMYSEGGMMSPDGHCRAFDARAQGTVFGSGIGLVVMKRVQDAVADGDHIYAVIRGAAINNDGSDKVSYTAPSVGGQAEAILTAQTLAGVAPDSISYVEAHGTGTPLGDPIEIAALTQAFRAAGSKNKQFCAIGSVKTNVGHLDVASGVTGLIKTSLALQHGEIPPSLNYEKPNPKIDFEQSPFFVNTQLTPWKRGDTPRRAAVSSFGVGGTNAHAVLEEAPQRAPSPAAPPWQVLLLSARSEAALDAATLRLRDHVRAQPGINFADVAFTLQTGRRAFNHRRAIIARDLADAVDVLTKTPADPKRVFTTLQEKRNPPVVFMFPGQGAQYVRMGAELAQREPVFRAAIGQCAELARNELGCDLRDLLWPDLTDAAATAAAEAALAETRITQPALFAFEYALARLWMSWGLQPAAMIGHSLGEYVAACLAGVFTLEDALRLVIRRAALVHAQPRGAMLAVRASEADVLAVLPPGLDLAASNAPGLCVVAGPDEAIAAFETTLDSRRLASSRLKTSHAFHSAMLEAVIAPFTAEVARTPLHPPKIRCMSNVTGQWLTDAEATSPDYWASHLRRTVRFADGIAEVLTDPDAILLEVGPGTTLMSLARKQPAAQGERLVLASLSGSPTQESAGLQTALGRLWLSGMNPDWSAVHSPQHRRRVPLPTYPFERKRYFVDAPAPADPEQHFRPAASPLPSSPATPLHDPSPPAALGEPPPSLVMSLPNSAPTRSARRERILNELCALFHELAGVEIGERECTSSFLELGFDSLFLTQARQNLQGKFGVNISYRQLVEDLSNVDALAEYIDDKLPPEAPAPSTPLPAVAHVAAQPAQPLASAPAPLASPAPAAVSAAASGDALARLLEQQMQTMSQIFAQQLTALRGAAPAGAMPVSASAPVAAVASPAPATAAVPAPAAPAKIAPPAAPAPLEIKAHGPYRPPTKARGDTLTPRQREYLTALTERFTQRTPRSKEYAQRHRRDIADPRSIANFRQLWKELVYQIVIERSDGTQLWDIDGNRYLDMTLGFGVHFLGHRPPFVIQALNEQLEKGTHIGPQSPLTGEVAALFREMTGHERVSFCNTGSEAVMAAFRVARTVTRRNKIVYFNGDYHGLFDEVLLRPQPNTQPPRSVPVAPGIPPKAGEDTWILDYGTPATLEFLRQHGSEIAAVIVEPVQSRNPTLQPREFLHEVRRITSACGALLIFDEIITGFRVHPQGAQGYFGVKADMATYGKIIGGGLPIGVLAGTAACLDSLDGGFWQFADDSGPEADVTFFAGTFVRHPLALAAARATLLHLKAQGLALQENLNRLTTTMATTLNTFFTEAGVPISIQHFSSQFRFHFPPELTSATLLIFRLLERGIYIRETHQNCFLSTVHTEADVAEFVSAVKDCVTELQLAEFFPGTPLPRIAAPASVAALPATPATPPQPYALTDAQREIWHACQLGAGASCAYNESFTLTLRGNLAVDALRASLQELINRHEALRLTFAADGSSQVPASQLALDIGWQDWSTLEEPERRARVTSIAEDENAKPFDLVRGPLVRVRLCRLSANEHLLVFTAHHLVCDGWSSGVLLDDLSRSYSARTTGRAAESPAAIAFSQFAQEEETHRAGADFTTTERYWLDRFSPTPPPLELPTDFPRTAHAVNRCGIERAFFDVTLCTSLKRAAASQGCTLFASLLGAFNVLLLRLSDQPDLVVGIFSAGQADSGHDTLVGHCVNMLPIRSQADVNEPFSRWLKTVNRQLLDAREHGNYTFGRLLQKLKLPRVSGRAPLVSAIFNLERKGDEKLAFAGLETDLEQNPHGFVNFDLFLNLRETKGGITADLEYNAALFEPATARRWLGHFETLLRGIAAAPETSLGTLPLLDEEQREQLLRGWNATSMGFPREACLHQLFETQARETPTAIALVAGTQRLTYAALDEQANRMANYLRNCGITPGSNVGICLPRNADLVVALLAVLKTGATYVPLDPTHPPQRMAYIVQDARIQSIITHSTLSAPLSAAAHARPLCVDLSQGLIATAGVDAPPCTARATDPAYVIYTSGSTGRPKGVAIAHRSAVSFVVWARTVYSHSDFEGVLAATSICFDLSIFEIFGTLAAGGKIILAENALQLPNLAAAEEVRLINTVPSAAAELLRADAIPSSVETINLAGEPLSRELVQALYERPHLKRVFDLYGPTECTTYSTAALREADGPATIGRPIANTQVYILDARLQPVPVGVAGELCIAGEGVALGYLNRPELTAEKFVPAPFSSSDEPVRLYRTGDRARYRSDGNIEFLGRTDHQVKIRGYRIELGEIESVLRQHPDVQACVVVGRADASGHQALVAYVASLCCALDFVELRTHLLEQLPDYMVPTAFVRLDELPLNANGKVDRAALPAPGDTISTSSAYVAPRNTTEEVLAEMWCEVMGLERIGVHDSFFELGGHSLMAMQVMSRINSRLGVELTLLQLFNAPTVARLAVVLEDALLKELTVPADAQGTN